METHKNFLESHINDLQKYDKNARGCVKGKPNKSSEPPLIYGANTAIDDGYLLSFLLGFLYFVSQV